MVFTSNGSRNIEIDRRFDKGNGVLSELCRSVVTKQELSRTAKLSVLQSLFRFSGSVTNLGF